MKAPLEDISTRHQQRVALDSSVRSLMFLSRSLHQRHTQEHERNKPRRFKSVHSQYLMILSSALTLGESNVVATLLRFSDSRVLKSARSKSRLTLPDSDQMSESNLTNADEERFMISRLARAGHPREEATASLFRRYAPLFQGYFQRHGLRSAEAEELVQEVFILILRGASGYRSSAAPPSAWLWMIARNALISHQRRKEPVVDDEQVYMAALERWSDAPESSDEDLADCVKR